MYTPARLCIIYRLKLTIYMLLNLHILFILIGKISVDCLQHGNIDSYMSML